MSKDSIEVSPKYGVNPSLIKCAWCGESKGISLMGRIREKDSTGKAVRGSDVEAPKEIILDYEPCDACKAQWQNGVTLIEVMTEPMADNQMPIQRGAYPTGRCAVVKPEALNGEWHAGQRALVLASDYRQIMGEAAM